MLKIKEKGKEWDKVNILEHFRSCIGIGPAAIYHDLRLQYLRPLFQVNVRVFQSNEVDFARHWLEQSP